MGQILCSTERILVLKTMIACFSHKLDKMFHFLMAASLNDCFIDSLEILIHYTN